MKIKHLVTTIIIIILQTCIGSYPINLKTKKESKMSNVVNIIELTQQNDFFRKELITGKHSQVVLMSIPVGSEIGQEVHSVDQTLIIVSGKGQAILNGIVSEIEQNSLIFVIAGTQHNIKNTGNQPLKLYTVYAPAQHKPGTLEKTKKAY